RRHTRFSRDWSSDVCSSDLRPSITGHDCYYKTSHGPGYALARNAPQILHHRASVFPPLPAIVSLQLFLESENHNALKPPESCPEIGRAACRESVMIIECFGA